MLAILIRRAPPWFGSYRKSFSRFSEFVPLTAAGATESAAPKAAAAVAADEADGGEEAAEAEAEGEGEAEGEPEAVAVAAAEAAPPAPRFYTCLLYTSPSPRDGLLSRMPSSA